MNIVQAPAVRAQMLIRRPVAAVFEAFVDPSITSRFWFTRSSGRLDQGKQVTWHWGEYGATAHVTARSIEHNRRILIEWPTPVEWLFTPHRTTRRWWSSPLPGLPEAMTRRWRRPSTRWAASVCFWRAARRIWNMAFC